MNFTSFTIQGNIISTEILSKIREEDIKSQTPASFGLDAKASLRDEIGVAWAAAKAHYTAFKLRVERLSESDSGTSITRNSWIMPLLRELGYELETARAYTLPDSQKTYPVSHKATNRGNFAVHIVGVNDSLDKRRETGGTRLSPHALVQEFLNNTEHDYALVTNGRYLRLLRDATRLVRLSYLEVNLEKIMEEDLYADFAVVFRLLHASRMPAQPDEISESIIEYYHQESLSTGSRIRNKLSKAVEKSIKELANGFLQHADNESIRTMVLSGTMTPADYYLYQLRVIYRLLFLIVTEERNLVYPDSKDPEIQRLRKIYYDFYSIERLRRLARKAMFIDGQKKDLWEGLKTTFTLFENAHVGARLGIQPLGSGLFSHDALGELPNLSLSNAVLLGVIRHLTLFENDAHQLVRVNYLDLDVEEFGSVYEGLLEYDAQFIEIDGVPKFAFVEGTGRAESGAHYTPEELVKPLIKHSLDHLIEQRLKVASEREEALLSLKIADVACGSGHILLSAARRIALELARVRTREDQPAPTAIRQALRDVIKNCIYGVDKNPLAVELCKVALWLEAHNPGEPLNFLDHHIKCGDAIVGLAQWEDLQQGIATEAFKALPNDDKTIATLFRNRNKTEAASKNQLTLEDQQALTKDMNAVMSDFQRFGALPERTPDEILAKQHAYTRLLNSQSHVRLKLLADLQLMPFFVAKTPENQASLLTDATYRQYLRGVGHPTTFQETKAITTATTHQFFHWFLEFPDIFTQGGFDCILGNPPFLGGLKLSTHFGQNYLNHLHYFYRPAGGTCDLVAYFFRRIYSLNKPEGFLSLISTNTIAQGDTRAGGLEAMVAEGGSINHAVKSMKWPGLAAVEVALVSVFKGQWKRPFVLDTKTVETITPFLDSAQTIGNPYPLVQNQGKSFVGSYVLGKGFVLEPHEAQALIARNPQNKDVLFPYLNGDDLNSNPDQSPSRWVINFFDWPLYRYTTAEWNALDKQLRQTIRKHLNEGKFEAVAPPDYVAPVAADYPDCLEIVERLVKPERQRWAIDKTGKEIIGEYALRKPLPERWWHYGEKRPGLYQTIKNNKQVLAVPLVSKYTSFELYPVSLVFMHKLAVIVEDKYNKFAILSSSTHNLWSWKNCSTLGAGTLNYSPTDAFETYPFPQNLTPEQEQELETIGEIYYEHRKQLMLEVQLGLTKTYNLFHSRELKPIGSEWFEQNGVENPKKMEKEYGKDALFLWKHLQKTFEGEPASQILQRFNAAVAGIIRLRQLHVQMDNAVLSAYGWLSPLSMEGSDRRTEGQGVRLDFYEIDYLPENDRIRYTIHPEVRKEVLKRLLELNHQIHAEEEKAAALQATLKGKKGKESKKLNIGDVEIGSVLAEPKSTYEKKSSQVSPMSLLEVTTPLFGGVTISPVIAEKSRVTLDTDGKLLRVCLLAGIQEGGFSGSFQNIRLDNPLAQVLLGKRVGDIISHEGKAYKIVNVG